MFLINSEVASIQKNIACVYLVIYKIDTDADVHACILSLPPWHNREMHTPVPAHTFTTSTDMSDSIRFKSVCHYNTNPEKKRHD